MRILDKFTPLPSASQPDMDNGFLGLKIIHMAFQLGLILPGRA